MSVPHAALVSLKISELLLCLGQGAVWWYAGLNVFYDRAGFSFGKETSQIFIELLALRVRQARDRLKGCGYVFAGMVEVNHLSDFLGIDLEVFEHARNSIPYPVSTVGHKDDLFGLGNSCCGNVLFEQGEDSIGIAERGVVDGKVVPPAAPFAVNGIDDEQLGFTPMAMEPMVPCRSSTPPFGASGADSPSIWL